MSAEAGTLDLSGSSIGEDLELIRTERGGPLVTSPDGKGGYGSRLVTRSVSGQLGGTIDYDWSSDGLVVTLRLSGNHHNILP
jgi:two-component sensor histidine kinase